MRYIFGIIIVGIKLQGDLIMRKSCLYCTRKHLGQAEVLLYEAFNSYPEHFWLAIGHLAEAEAETQQKFLQFSRKIRLERCKLMDNFDYPINIIALICEATELEKDNPNLKQDFTKPKKGQFHQSLPQ